MARTITGADSFAAVYLNGVRSPGIARIRSLRPLLGRWVGGGR